MRNILISTFLITLAAWMFFSWPLPRMVHRAIPCSASNHHGAPPRYQVPGDHLQLLYRFWLLGDVLRGNSPWGGNVYEFNRGDDGERRQPGAYYLPFSLVYGAGALISPALGWNLTGILSLWLTLLATALLAGHYAGRFHWGLAFAVISVCFTYRHHTLMGGSPTGFAMLWPPVIILGIEQACRQDRVSGGWLAAAGLAMACTSDVQLFFFSVLFAGGWTLMVAAREMVTRPARPAMVILRLFRSLWPVALSLAACYLYTRHIAAAMASSQHMAGGRSLSEVAQFAPDWRDLLGWGPGASREDQGAFLGYAWMAAFGVLTVAGMRAEGRARRDQLLISAWWALLVMAVVVLALGTNSPGRGWLFVKAREWLPPLEMIRQPSRILVVFPTLVAVALSSIAAPTLRRWRATPVAAALILMGLWTAMEHRARIRPEICMLETKQEAYAAIRKEYEARQDPHPRAIAIPLWPGDTHWSSLYTWYASCYGIRMLNGYTPVVPAYYVDEVFEYFRSLNAGILTNDQVDRLLGMNIRCLVFHEDAFPEIVSPFPAWSTLNRFLAHPRLELINRDAGAWAFRLLEKERLMEAPSPPAFASCDLFPSRRFNPEKSGGRGAVGLDDPQAIGQGYARLEGVGQSIQVGRASLASVPMVGWLAHVRGQGTLSVWFDSESGRWLSRPHALSSDDWTWVFYPGDGLPVYGAGAVGFVLEEGTVDIDYLSYTSVSEPLREARWSPACFFRSGMADVATGDVEFRPDRDARARIFYGPRVPFRPGVYRAVLEYESPAPAGEILGTWMLEIPEGRGVAEAPVSGGTNRVELAGIILDQHPLVLSFHYRARQAVRLKSVEVVPETPGREQE